MLSSLTVVPIVIAVILFVLPFEKIVKAITVLAQVTILAFSCYVFLLCKNGEIAVRMGNYEGFLGIILRADTLTSVFLMLTSFIFLIVTIYSFSEHNNRRLGFFLLIWQGLLNGVFLSSDMFNILILVELVTVVISVLIMFTRDTRSLYDGMVYMMVSIVAMQFYLFGVGYLYKLTGTLDMTAVTQATGLLNKASLVLPYALIMTAISLKCAVIPLFSWHPKAHGTASAPTIVSAILSGLHVKSSIYLFIRFHNVFSAIATPEFFLILGIIAGIGGALLALSQTDIKLILAFSTISQVGMIFIGLNIADIHSYTGSVYHVINHALFKTALFLCAGIVTDAYGTRDISRIRGVVKGYPLVGVAIIMSILGIIGTPFFNGSISKYFIVSGADWLTKGIVIIINLGTIIVFMKYSTILFGRKSETIALEKTDVCKQISVLFLGMLCLAGGIFGEQLIEFFFNIAVSIDAAGYIEKGGLFVLSMVVGYILFKYFIDKHAVFMQIRKFRMSFRWMCASIGGFFALILLVTRLYTA